jgi:hypothetical protein
MDVRLEIASKEVATISNVLAIADTTSDAKFEAAVARAATKLTRYVISSLLQSSMTSYPYETGFKSFLTADRLFEKFAAASNEIHREHQRGPATWVVVGIDAGERLVRKFIVNGLSVPPEFKDLRDMLNCREVVMAGSMLGKWHLFIDSDFPEDRLLIGRGPSSTIDGDAIFTPHYFGLNEPHIEEVQSPMVGGESEYRAHKDKTPVFARFALTVIRPPKSVDAISA